MVFRIFQRILLLGGCLALAACNEIPLYSDLSEKEANEIMAVMVQNGIECKKTAGQEGKWVLSIPPADMPVAMEHLNTLGLPRAHLDNMGEVFNKSGLVSSPSEERIRFMYSLSQELSRTLMDIDGVVNARVHIVLPENDPLGDNIKPASAAVFIKYQPGYNLESSAPDIKNLVTKSVEGLTFENVSLILVPAQASWPAAAAGAATPAAVSTPEKRDWLEIAISAGAGAALAVILFLGYSQIFGRSKRRADVPA